MLSLSLIICFASSLLITTSAVPTKRSLSLLTPSDVSPSTLSNSSLPAALLADDLAIRQQPGCWPSNPPIANSADCVHAKVNMLLEVPLLNRDEPVVWDRAQGWRYRSCVLYLVISWNARDLPIHRGTFSRGDIAECAARVQKDCVTREHGYRGGKIAIDAGVFEVALAPAPPSANDWEEGIILNTTAFE